MKTEPQKMYIAVRPDGTMCGPCMDTKSATEEALDIAWIRIKNVVGDRDGFLGHDKHPWEQYGYSVIPCIVTPLIE